MQLEEGSTWLRRAVCGVAPRTCLCPTEPPNCEWSVGRRRQRRDAVGSTRDACAPHFQLNCHGLTARKFSHVLIVPEESGPTFFQAFTSLNKPELVNESENPLRVK